jgi:hypothetical protein
LKNVAENFGAGLRENQFRVNEMTSDYYLWAGLKDNAYKSLLEQTNKHHQHYISTISRQESQS